MLYFLNGTLHENSKQSLPEGAIQLTPEEYKKLSSEEFVFVDGALVQCISLPVTAEEENAPIFLALDLIDRKSIRALREGNSARLIELESQAAALRERLKK